MKGGERAGGDTTLKMGLNIFFDFWFKKIIGRKDGFVSHYSTNLLTPLEING